MRKIAEGNDRVREGIQKNETKNFKCFVRKLLFLNSENKNFDRYNNNKTRSNAGNNKTIPKATSRSFMANEMEATSSAANTFLYNDEHHFHDQSRQLKKSKSSSSSWINNYFKNIVIREEEEEEGEGEEDYKKESEPGEGDKRAHCTESYEAIIDNENNLLITFDYGFNDSFDEQQFNEKKINTINSFMLNNNEEDVCEYEEYANSIMNDNNDNDVQLWLPTSPQTKFTNEQFPVHRMRHNIKDSDMSFLSTLTEYDVDDGEEVLPLSPKLHLT